MVNKADKNEARLRRHRRVRGKRPPEPYKGKGIRYVGEFVIRKEGKAGKGK